MRRLKFRNTALSILKPYILYLQFIIISANFGNSIFYYKIAGTAIMAYWYAYSLFAPQLTLNMRRIFAFDEYACLANTVVVGVSSSCDLDITQCALNALYPVQHFTPSHRK
jgi:hypothetical protein